MRTAGWVTCWSIVLTIFIAALVYFGLLIPVFVELLLLGVLAGLGVLLYAAGRLLVDVLDPMGRHR